jgi:hypothetical protein
MNSLDADPYFQFGAYYTKIISGQEWEKYDRTGDYADIIVELGKEKGKFVFWRMVKVRCRIK